METSNDAAVFLLVIVAAALFTPVIGKVGRFLYNFITVILKFGTSAVIASIVIGIFRENVYVKMIIDVSSRMLHSVGVSYTAPVYEQAVTEQAKESARSIMKDGIMKVIKFI
jgi:hypothetical protein